MTDKGLFTSRLTAFKERLLDLSGRNRMIHSNFQARTKLHFRFIDGKDTYLRVGPSTEKIEGPELVKFSKKFV